MPAMSRAGGQREVCRPRTGVRRPRQPMTDDLGKSIRPFASSARGRRYGHTSPQHPRDRRHRPADRGVRGGAPRPRHRDPPCDASSSTSSANLPRHWSSCPITRSTCRRSCRSRRALSRGRRGARLHRTAPLPRSIRKLGVAALFGRGLGPFTTLAFEVGQAPAARDSVSTACWLVPEMGIPPPRLAGAMAALRLGDLAVDRPNLIVGLQPITAPPAQMDVMHFHHDTSARRQDAPRREAPPRVGDACRSTSRLTLALELPVADRCSNSEGANMGVRMGEWRNRLAGLPSGMIQGVAARARPASRFHRA
jgi:hypothetical protein